GNGGAIVKPTGLVEAGIRRGDVMPATGQQRDKDRSEVSFSSGNKKSHSKFADRHTTNRFSPTILSRTNYQSFQGGFPDFHKSSSNSLSRNVSIDCQNPVCR